MNEVKYIKRIISIQLIVCFVMFIACCMYVLSAMLNIKFNADNGLSNCNNTVVELLYRDVFTSVIFFIIFFLIITIVAILIFRVAKK